MKFFYQLFFLFATVASFAQNQLWKGYFSYQETKAVEKDNENVYIATDNSVFVYNKNSKETEIFNTVNGLKIDGIHTLAYAVDYKKLIVGSESGKVAVIDLAADKIYHLNDIYTKTSIPDNLKKINRITVNGGFAYLATDYGITVVRLSDNHFGDTYYIGAEGDMVSVKSVAVLNNQIYAGLAGQGLKKATLNSNLIDFNAWQIIDFGNWIDLVKFNNEIAGVKEDLSLNKISATNQIEKVDDVWGGFLKLNVSGDILIEITKEAVRLRSNSYSVYNEFIFSLAEKGGIYDATFADGNYYVASQKNGALKVASENKSIIENVSPAGPLSNNVFALTLKNRDLWVTFGGYGGDMDPYNPNGLTEYGISQFKNMQTWQSLSFDELKSFKATTNISFNPQVNNIAYISSFHDGLALLDLTTNEVDIYNDQNSLLKPIVPNDIRINGVAFDKNGTGWMTNIGVNPFLVSIDKNKQFKEYHVSSYNEDQEERFLIPVIDKNNTKWIGTRLGGLLAFNETRNNKSMLITTTHNLSDNMVKTLALDYNNQLWIGTARGLRIIPNVDQFLTQSQLTASDIVIEDQGKGQELFFQQDILAITVDGSNNKWVSVAESGVFLISGDGRETIYRFTKENSPLPSNDILGITIDGTTGDVFFASRKGIVSFKNYATTPSENLDQLKVYPNPVKPEYTGDVKISGVTSGANIKITDVAGNLVFETKSLGGTVTWNTVNFSGAKVSSGVYMIFVSSEDGTLDGVSKVMIIR